MTAGTFMAIDAFLGTAPGMTGRQPDPLEALYSDLLETERRADRKPPSRRELAELRARVDEALSSNDRGRRPDRVSIQPDSFRVGSPDGPKRSPRPLKRHVDEWLADGGWTAGKDGAGSVALAEEDTQQARDHLTYRWRQEIADRGWTGRWLKHMYRPEPDGLGGTQTRMYWWRLPGKGPEVPPDPPSGPVTAEGDTDHG